MRITILGCGTSVGVPALGHAGWGSCDPNDSRNRRQRCSVLVEVNGATILVDAGPDIRNQLLPHQLTKVDAVLITHTHSDHIAGLDDLRAFYWPEREDIKIYATAYHGKDILARFPYLFTKKSNSPSYFVPPMAMHQIDAGTQINIGGCKIDVLHQDHGNSTSLGFLFDGSLYALKQQNYSDNFSDLYNVDSSNMIELNNENKITTCNPFTGSGVNKITFNSLGETICEAS